MQFHTIATILAAFAATNVAATPLPAPVAEAAPEAITKRHNGGDGGYWAVYKPQTVPVAWRFYGDMGSQAHSEKDVLSVLGIPLLSTDKESYSSYQDQGYDVVYVTQ